MSLIIHDTISLTTASGVSRIQLCIGDITKLSKEEEVDVLVVSAFPGDYSPTPSSLIGALAINLGISVRNLSKDKEEDLRKQYFCWWSKPLPEQYSFRRILCFEGGFGSRGSSPPKVVGAVFRCLIPVLSGKDCKGGSVIMPLLASGDQGYSKQLMLRLIINSAIQWIKAGLELKSLKVVLFSRNPTKPDKSHKPLFECFQKMKDTYGDKELTYETEIIYDVYMSHSPKDHESALQIAKFLRTERKIRVFHDFQELNDDESWQEEIFNIMGKCARVIALLTPGYLETESCIEQYNMALCINRRSHGTVLAPFYITSMDYMPTYMSLIQYEDCRPKDTEKIKVASDNVANSLKKPQEGVSSSVTKTKTTETLNNDVFISYSHQNRSHADKVLQTLKSLDPDLKIFIDTSGLNTGTSWQQMLYNSLDASKSTIALLSPDYIKSKVCYEEFCLSHALFVDKDRGMDLVSLLVEPVQKLPLWCEQPLPVDCASPHVDADQVLSSLCTDLVNKLKGANNTADDILTQRVHDLKKGNLTLESSMDHYRKSLFVLRSGVLKTPVDFTSSNDKESLRESHASDVVMSVDGHHVSVDRSTNATSAEVTSSNSTSSQVTSSGSTICDVALSFAAGDTKAAIILKQLLLEKLPTLKISEPLAGDFSRVQSLDVARVIVLLLSPSFLASSELVEELNIAIYRNRCSLRRILFPVQVAVIPPKPSYVHLIPSEFSCNDYKWACKIVDRDLQDEVCRMAQRSDIDVDEAFCLRTAAGVISERLLEEEKPDLNLENRVLLNVHEVEENWKRVQMALQQEDGLEKWKAAFGIEMKSKEDDLKPARITQEHADDETEASIAGESESNGVELHLKDIRSEGQGTGVATDSQPRYREHGVEVGSNQSASSKVHFDVDENNQDGVSSSTQHVASVSGKESKACSEAAIVGESESNGVELHLNDITNEEQSTDVGTDSQPRSREREVEVGGNQSASSKEHKTVHFDVDENNQDGVSISTQHAASVSGKESKACSII